MKQVLRELYYILSPNTSPGKHKILFSKQLKGPSFHSLLMFIIIYKVSQDFFFLFGLLKGSPKTCLQTKCQLYPSIQDS